jgi:hypothetical protein
MSILELTNHQIIRDIVKVLIQVQDNNEKVYLNKLKTKLEEYDINLLDLLVGSLLKNGGSFSDVDVLKNNFISMEVAGSLYDVFIFIPFSEEVNFEFTPIISSTINNNINKQNIEGIKFISSGNFNSENINQGIAKKNQIWFLSISNSNFSDIYPALPWQRCKCTRGTKVVDAPTQGVSSRGTCAKNGSCSECGRSNIWGTCPDKSCPGC